MKNLKMKNKKKKFKWSFPASIKNKKVKIIIRLEKEGKFIEKVIPHGVLCGFVDLQWMLIGAVDIEKSFKGIKKDVDKMFDILSHFDEAAHAPYLGTMEKGKMTWRKMKRREYTWGAPKWRRIKNDSDK